MKILVVDDSSTFRAIARKELEEEGGYEIIEAEDGEIALETLMSTPVNLVTMDVEMPGLNGYEVCKKIRSEEYSSKIIGSANNPLPLIFITGNDSLEERAKGFEAGAADFITKPFLSGELLASVDRLLKPENKFKGLTALVADDSQVVRFI
ncbi:MAG: response regulator, partial [Nitrospinae bacterium]|nr:response regulator [Nitrospinota bacterium]